MNGMPKIIKTLTGSGTAIGVVVIVLGNVMMTASRSASHVGLALRSLGLLLALVALGTFLCISVGRRIMRRMALAVEARQRPAMETAMNRNLSPFQAHQPLPSPPTPALVILGRGCAILLLVLSAITFLSACVSLVQVRPWGVELLYFLVQPFTATLSLLGVALLLWIAAEALNKSARNHWLLVRLLQQHEATGLEAATIHGTSLPSVSNASITEQPIDEALHAPRDLLDNQ